jgi:predicted nucleic acid-binding protein
MHDRCSSSTPAAVRDWLAQPSATLLEPSGRHLEILAGLLVEAGTAANLVGDAHLATLAVERDATIVSFDADFGRFAGVRLQVPAP